MYRSCTKCGGVKLHTEVKGNNTGLYCNDCGKWQRWLGKDELRAFEHSMREATKEERESVDKYIKSISKPTGTNFFEDKPIVERLTEFVERIDKEIDNEYEKNPLSTEDYIKKISYCYALQKVKCSLENILAGRDFDDVGGD